jgi:4-hydroxyphenylpyruvate dioxygenase
MRTSIATVCLSGGLREKLHACAEAGFDGVEIMGADLIAAYESPEEIRAMCERLGLTIELFQPFRDVEGVDDVTFARTLRRAEATFRVMQRVGADLLLVCSNVASASIDDDDLAARQLGDLADLADEYGIRIAYEALAWGRFVDDYRHAWRIVQRANRPNLGVCLDSFHIISRRLDPADIESIDAEKIFFVQLSDAPALDMDLLLWSRHHRLFPGEGSFDLETFLVHVLRAGYDGPLSLEVFNDTYRQTDVTRTAAHARRSLTWLADRTAEHNRWQSDRVGDPQVAHGIDFVEIGGADLTAFDRLFSQLGLSYQGRHRSMRLWSGGDARFILNEQSGFHDPRISGFGLRVDDAQAAASRGRALGAASVDQRGFAADQLFPAVASPEGTVLSWNDRDPDQSWLTEFTGGEPAANPLRGTIDHISVVCLWQDYDEAVLFAKSVLSLSGDAVHDVSGPLGLVRSQVMRTEDGVIRLPINMTPIGSSRPPRHVAIRVDDVLAVAESARAAGLEPLPIPANYYDDLAGRVELGAEFVARLRDLDVLYDSDDAGEFLHFYTAAVGSVIIEVVERRGSYDGYGAANAPIRLAAQRIIGLEPSPPS